MKKIKTRSWRTDYGERLTVDDLHLKYPPAEFFRISKRHFDAGSVFISIGNSETIFVLRGSYTIKTADEETVLNAGEYATIPQGRSEIKVGKESDTEIIRVLDLAGC